MSNVSGCLGAWLIAMLVASPAAQATTFRIDDSGTVVGEPLLQMRWRHPAPGRAAEGNDVVGGVRVDLRLNVGPWLNRRCRIFLALAPTLQAPVHATWGTQGILMPGRVRSGERTLVYEGVAAPSVMTESLQLSLETDGTRLGRTEPLQFFFEIEVMQ